MKTFEKDWHICRIGKTEIENDNGWWRVFSNGGKRLISGDKAAAWLANHPEKMSIFNDWFAWRKAEVEKWKHETPHFRVCADAGSIALRINGARLLVAVGGDGSHPVYATTDTDVPPTFRRTGFCVAGECNVEVLDYDCDPAAEVVAKIELAAKDKLHICVDADGAMILRHCTTVGC